MGLADRAAGSRGKCPHCGAVLQIPAAAPAAPAPKPAAGPASAKLSFACSGCGKTITAPSAMAGKRGKCPHCQATMVIGGAPAAGDLTPLAGDDLAPLAAPPEDDLFAGLPPLAPLPALDAKVLPDGPPLNPLGVAPASWSTVPAKPAGTNPFASSASVGAAPHTAPVKLLVPAILLFVVSLLSIGSGIYNGINVLQPKWCTEQIREFLHSLTKP